VVAVIDTGIRPHLDLVGRTVAGYDFISNVSIANDGDGRDADPSDPGDWVLAGECGTGSTVRNSSWHGTHVAGTIGALSNNGLGVTGVNWNSRILPVRVLGKCGGLTSDIVDGARWAAGLAVTGVPANANPAKVLNLSLGGSGTCSTTYQTAIDVIVAAGSVFVVAAGNSAVNASGAQPANCKGVITVAANNRGGDLASYSNFSTTLVKISAPGGETSTQANGVLSTLNSGTTTPAADSYVYYQGTSMAAPHVAGIASLMLSANASLTPTQVLAIIQNTARPFAVGTLCALYNDCGAGIINAAAAVAAAATGDITAPTVPVSLVASAVSESQTNLSWTPSTDSGGSGVAGYKIERCTGSVCISFAQIATARSTNYSDTGRAPSTTYAYRLRAYDIVGNDSEYSNTASATTNAGVTIGEAVDNTALTWTTGGNANWFGQSAVSFFEVDAAQSGLISDGQTSWVETSVTGPRTLSFYWKVSSEQGFDFLRFYIGGLEQPGRISGTVDWQQKTFSIPSGSQTLRWAYTKDSSFSGGADAGWLDNVVVFTTETIPPTVPSSLLAGSVSSSQINISWTASTDSGGSGLSGYKVERCAGSGCSSFVQIAITSSTSYSDSSLSASTTYIYRVRAYDNAGNNSGYSNSATPALQDLVITAMTAANSVASGAPVVGSAIVKNQGTVSAGASRLQFYASTDSVITSADINTGFGCNVPVLAAAASFDCAGTISVLNLNPGSYYFGAIADVDSAVAESNETNNSLAAGAPTLITGTPPVTNGVCGSANDSTTPTIPTNQLCNVGIPTPVTGTGPWNWTCTGSSGGTTASCSANKGPASSNSFPLIPLIVLLL